MTGCYDIPCAAGLGARRAHRQGADRSLPRRRPARGRVPARADRRPRRARARARAGRAAPAQPDPLLPAPERAGLDVRLGRLRALPRSGARAGRSPSAATRCVVGTGVAMYVERAGGNWESARVSVAARRPRDRPQRIVARTARDTRRRSRRSCADRLGDRPRRRRAAVRRHAMCRRRRDVREPLGGDGRLGARAGERADPRVRPPAWPRGCWTARPRRSAASGAVGGPRTVASVSLAESPPPAASRRRRGSSPTSCSARARTRRWSRSSAPPAR